MGLNSAAGGRLRVAVALVNAQLGAPRGIGPRQTDHVASSPRAALGPREPSEDWAAPAVVARGLLRVVELRFPGSGAQVPQVVLAAAKPQGAPGGSSTW